MGQILLYIIFVTTALTALFLPWVGIVASYLIAILMPQNIWWWNFEGIRPFYFVAIPTIIGTLGALIRGNAYLKETLNSTINKLLLLFWLLVCLSYFVGPYVNVFNQYRLFEPSVVFSHLTKIFFFFFLTFMFKHSENRVKSLTLVIIISTAYFIYWINAQYLFEGQYGRIGGPAGIYTSSIYKDENIFATIFVTGLPFIYYFGHYVDNKPLKYFSWCLVPLGWHAIFLTGSRGGLLGLAATIVLISIRSKKKIIGLLIIPVFVGTFLWQGGAIMKERTLTISKYNTEESASARLQAWEAAGEMIKSHPLTGVGISSFMQAFPSFSNNKPRVAHNTYLEITAECGFFAGIIYLFITLYSIFKLWVNSKIIIKNNTDHEISQFWFFLNEACLVSLVGFFVCALFLSLIRYEVYYYLLILTNICLIHSLTKNNTQNIPKEYFRIQ
jgi:putative inorganic carbon (HCO3(-)) transporter